MLVPRLYFVSSTQMDRPVATSYTTRSMQKSKPGVLPTCTGSWLLRLQPEGTCMRSHSAMKEAAIPSGPRSLNQAAPSLHPPPLTDPALVAPSIAAVLGVSEVGEHLLL